MLNREEILTFLRHPLPVYCHESLPSTNDKAKALARQGAAQGTLVLSDTQTKGRGLRGRCFLSPFGGLYMSLVVDTKDAMPGHLTTLAAVAVTRAVREVSWHELGIKWVNDLLYEGKKAGGILTEGVASASGTIKQVIGIGVNTGPAPLPSPAGNICRPGEIYKRERLAALIADLILDGLPRIPAHMDEYRALCRTIGQQVSFEYGGEEKAGLAVGIDDDGALMVSTESGLLRLIAGDVSVQPAL
jgi:BirA family biotin operon repressor/biotin-[acetyl-CoA-carboxylase] ligase